MQSNVLFLEEARCLEHQQLHQKGTSEGRLRQKSPAAFDLTFGFAFDLAFGITFDVAF